jgi:4-hydroxybenzoate polyprenyltransferase
MLITYYTSLNFIKNVFQGLRPSVSLPAGFLVHVGAKLNNLETNWFLVFITFMITGLIMLQNDYFDREYDFFKKDKKFVFENKNNIFWILIFSWLTVFLFTFLFTIKIQIFTVIIATIGILYSFLKNIFPLPLLTVALLSALPVMLQGEISQNTILFFSMVVVAILGREILKDIEDRHTDFNYKKTLLTETSFPLETLNKFVVTLFLISLTIFILFVLKSTDTKQLLSIVPIVFIGVTIYKLLKSNKNTTIAKRYFDLAMFGIIVIFSI